MRKKNKITSLILSIILMWSLVLIPTYANEEETSTIAENNEIQNDVIEPQLSDEEKEIINNQRSDAYYTTKSSDNGVLQKIEKLKSVYPEGSYFTVNQKSCGNAWHLGCENCKLENILKKRHPEMVGKIHDQSYSCCAFARFAFYYIFGTGTDKDFVNMSYVGNSLDRALPGDYIVYYANDNTNTIAHYAIYLDNGAVLDSNATGDSACKVKYGNYWATNYYTKKVEVYRANNYTEVNNTHYQIFSDVPYGSWYYDAVNYVEQRKIMTGLDATNFGANSSLARAQMAVMLYRMAGSPNTSYMGIFSDNSEGMWYSNAIVWAHNNNITTGYANGKFGINDSVNREQLATFLYRYAIAYGFDRNNSGNIYKYPDGNAVSSFAREAMNWTIGVGIIKGDNGYLNPQNSVNRAECATMIMRFMERYGL